MTLTLDRFADLPEVGEEIWLHPKGKAVLLGTVKKIRMTRKGWVVIL